MDRGLALLFVRARGEKQRFELSAVDQGTVIAVVTFGTCIASLLFTVFGLWVLIAWVVAFLASFSVRNALVITRSGAVVERRALGFVMGRRPLGIAPTVANLGYDWDEVAVVPRDEALRRGLQDNERAVIVEDVANPASTDRLLTLVRSEMERLHAWHFASGTYRKNARV